MVTVTTAAFLCLLLGAAFAAPAEDKDQKVAETPAEAPDSQSSGAAVLANFCPLGWYSFGLRCFTFIDTNKNWYSAEEHCNLLGGHLASVHNLKEYNFLQLLAQGSGYSTAWLGGFNLQNKWMWIDRADFRDTTTWFTSLSPTNRACTYLNYLSKACNDNCGSSRTFFCSKNPFGC